MKKLAVFLDGTWNDPGDNTNVWRLRSMLAPTDSNGIPQISYYDKGVGTKWYDRFRGGALGVGLATNIREAYQWLIENYDEDDEIYVFGFSRGAFTARSLTGMISKCGLIKPGAPMPVKQVYDRYENSDSRPIYRLPKQVKEGMSLEDCWMVQYSRRVKIKFIGVWDTVGALGVNFIPTRKNQRGEYNSHFVRLSNSFEHCYQALAIDEHRKAYPLSLWYHFVPEKVPDKTHQGPPEIEQRWFVGAHSNVGGGYRNDPLAQIPLAWIQDKAASVGLKFRYDIQLTEEHMAPPTDSFKEFLKGAYRIFKFGRRYYRTLGVAREQVSGGWIEPHFETIDESVFKKWQSDTRYRPKNLQEWADRNEHKLAEISGTQNVRE